MQLFSLKTQNIFLFFSKVCDIQSIPQVQKKRTLQSRNVPLIPLVIHFKTSLQLICVNYYVLRYQIVILCNSPRSPEDEHRDTSYGFACPLRNLRLCHAAEIIHPHHLSTVIRPRIFHQPLRFFDRRFYLHFNPLFRLEKFLRIHIEIIQPMHGICMRFRHV